MKTIKLKTGEELRIDWYYLWHILPWETTERPNWHYYLEGDKVYHIPKDNISYVVSDITKTDMNKRHDICWKIWYYS